MGEGKGADMNMNREIKKLNKKLENLEFDPETAVIIQNLIGFVETQKAVNEGMRKVLAMIRGLST